MDAAGSAESNATEPNATEPNAAAEPGRPYRYDARLAGDIEARWQARWEAEGTFHSPNPTGPLATGFDRVAGRRPFYVLDMFPYPSGTGLHVGHPLGYIGTDVYARYLRMTGHHVLHTLGYDAFGLPAEQYAIDTGQHPRVTIRNNIDTMRRQLRRLGLGHDRRREVATTDPGFYRWTQWIFLKIFNSWVDERTGRARPIGDLVAEFASGTRATPDGRPWTSLTGAERRKLVDGHRLAYLSEALVNWCPGLGTVLANEEVTADGRSDVGNFPVYRRPLRQWMLRITAFADRLIDDLDSVDWPDSIKQMQRNWIGASDGAFIRLPVVDRPGFSIEVFTTRPDTLRGATYVVLAPDHPLAERLGVPAEAGTRHGVATGASVVNPITREPMPVLLADYVVTDYGTGAVMGVPAHDQRDFDFARASGLEVRAVLRPPASWFAELGIAEDTPPARWPVAYDGEARDTGGDVGGGDIGRGDNGAGGAAGGGRGAAEAGGGDYLAAPDGPRLAGLSRRDAITAAITWLEDKGAGRRGRVYRLRDWLFSRQRYWGEPFPIVYDDSGSPVALPERMLPVRLPHMTDFRPEPHDADDADSEPTPPLARARDWAAVELDLGDGPARYRRELNTMPQWAGSCWYYLRYLDPANDRAFVDPEIDRYWMGAPGTGGDDAGGVGLYVGGGEHGVLHLLYARFWHKVLYDLGEVSTAEPFRRLYNQGYILADAFLDERGMYVPAADVVEAADGTPTYQGRPVTRRSGKMGKSLKNGVSPDSVYARYGADTLRLYEMAMGPLDADRPWRTDDIIGVHRFLRRLWRSLIDEETGHTRVSDRPPDDDSLRRLHRTITVVREGFAELRFNTAIARLTELVTFAARQAASGPGGLPRAFAEPLILMVAPLAPHIAEELWSRLGHAESLAYAAFPVADPAFAVEPVMRLPVQINGRTRFTIDVPGEASERDIERLLAGNADFARHTAGREVDRLIVVPGRIVNVVMGDRER